MSAFDVHIDLQGAAELERAWRQAPAMVIDELKAATWEAELLVQREVQERTPTGVGAGGGLKGSIHAQNPIIVSAGVLGVVGTSLSYAVPVELGTRPHMPPIQPLRDWVEHKLGIPEERSYGVARAIAFKIKHHGTEGAHMFREGFKASHRQVVQIFERARGRIVERLAGRR